MNNQKIYTYLGFAARSRTLMVGATGVLGSLKTGRAKLVLIGEEVGANTAKKMRSACEKAGVPLFVYDSCENLSRATGKTDKGIFALEDENLAKAVIEQIEKFQSETEEYL